MPKLKRVESLEKKCLCSLANLLANSPDVQLQKTITSSKPAGETEGESLSNYMRNLSDQLPWHLSEQVVEALRTNGRLHIKHHDLMITKGTRILDLSSVSGIDDTLKANFILELAATRCQQLTHLVLRHEKSCSQKLFYKLLPLFKNLRVLDVSHTMFDDTCMHILGDNFRNLKELDISSCTVTDDGIEGLCGDLTNPVEKMAMGLSGQCKSIEKLTIDGTKVTNVGVQMALRQLPHLKIFGQCLVIEALCEMHRHNKMDTILPKYAITKLGHFELYAEAYPDSCYTYTEGDLQLAATLCPFLTHLDIYCQLEVTDFELRGLVVLERLRILQIRNDCVRENEFRITFDGGLAPFLQARGSLLTTLALEDFPISVPLDFLVEFCPNLERFALECNFSNGLLGDGQIGRPNKRRKSDQVYWHHLEELKVKSRASSESVPLKELLLFTPPSLRRLVLDFCFGLNDDVLCEIVKLFKNLEHLGFHYCDGVTIDGINKLLNEANSLKKLRMFDYFSCGCETVLKKNLEYWGTEAKRKNWDLEILDYQDSFWFDVHYI